MNEDMKDLVEANGEENFLGYRGAGNAWIYSEFGGRRPSWECFYRVIYTKPIVGRCSLSSLARDDQLHESHDRQRDHPFNPLVE